MTMRGGRFAEGDDPRFTALNDSLPVDWRLAAEDVEGSIAWAGALEAAGVLTTEETKQLQDALRAVGVAAAADPEALRSAGDEDVHGWVERQLTERLGPLGRKLHTGRSRNDQVATDLRLWTRRVIEARQRELRVVQSGLLDLAEREAGTVIPGYTHLQRAQPVLFAHWCLAYFEMFDRDVERLADAARRAGRCPLGSAALAGTSYAIDRDALARELGFDGPTANSLDAVSDRDFVIETLGAVSLCFVHLSRLAEDLVFYASGEAGFVEHADTVSSGSSLMPQKKNPDALELLRGKAGGALGALVAMTTTMKGLPLAYNKDMQEDKAALFGVTDDLGLCLAILPVVLAGIRVDRDTAHRAAAAGYANATDLADHLVARGVPFRDAHEQVGRVVRHAIEAGSPLEELSLEDLRAIAPEVTDDVHADLTLETGLARRNVPGGTAPNQIRDALAAARARVAP